MYLILLFAVISLIFTVTEIEQHCFGSLRFSARCANPPTTPSLTEYEEAVNSTETPEEQTINAIKCIEL